MMDFNLENYYKNNIIIWFAIIMGMIILTGITYFFYQTNTFVPVEESLEYKNLFFALILISALAVLFLKRIFFDFEKNYSKISSSGIQNIKTDYFAKLRTNYIIIWSLSESIILLGFVEYVLVCDFQLFLMYAVIGLYAIVINFPKKSLFIKHLELLEEKSRTAL